MNLSYGIFKRCRIAFYMLFLILQAHTGICQIGTIGTTKVQQIVRDLQICDAIKLERDLQKGYISSLTAGLDASIFKEKETAKDRDKFKAKSKKRGKVIAVFIAAEVLKIGLTILIRK